MDVCMLVSNDVERDPRVRKSAQSLVEAGLSVGVIGISYKGIASAWTMQDEGFSVKLVTLNLSPRARIKNKLATTAPGPYRKLTRVYRQIRGIEEAPSKPRAAKTAPAADAPTEQEADERRRSIVRAAVKNRLARQGALTSTLFEAAALTFPAIIHAHDLDTLEAGVKAAELTGAALVFDSHEIWWQQHAEDEAVLEWNSYFQQLEAELIHKADRVITVCHSIADFFASQHSIEKPAVVRNAIRLEANATDSSEEFRETISPVEVLFHGGFAYNRGLEELIEAAKSFENATLVLRGFGSLENFLRDYVAKEGLQDVVRFDEPVAMKDVIKSASSSDIGIIPYRPVCLNNRFSTPNKLFEFMAAGTAVVASDLPELAHVINTENIGLVFEPGQSAEIAKVINELAADPQRVTQMRKRALVAARERHNWSVEEQELLKVYTSLNRPSLKDRALKVGAFTRKKCKSLF
jgi:glycogen synthase